jgi:hypothetical protein
MLSRALQGPGVQRLMQQSSAWFRKVRTASANVGGLGDLSQDLRDLAALASESHPLVLLVDGVDQLMDSCLHPIWHPSLSKSAAATGYAPADDVVEGLGDGDVTILHAMSRLFGWMPLSTSKGQDPLLPPYVRIVISHNRSAHACDSLPHEAWLMSAGTWATTRSHVSKPDPCVACCGRGWVWRECEAVILPRQV